MFKCLKDHLQIRAFVFNLDSLFGNQGHEPDGGGEDDYDVHLQHKFQNKFHPKCKTKIFSPQAREFHLSGVPGLVPLQSRAPGGLWLLPNIKDGFSSQNVNMAHIEPLLYNVECWRTFGHERAASKIHLGTKQTTIKKLEKLNLNILAYLIKRP